MYQRRRPTGPSPTREQIHKVAVDAIGTLRRIDVTGCFVGGYGCRLLGGTRQPNDLDILCLDTNLSQEEIKARLIQNNPRFYLVNPRSSFATYKVLWYHIAETNSCLKVDILLPGVLNIPSIPVSSITRRNADGLPCAPFSLVLLLKLQAWAHHGEAMEWRFRVKQPTDERDIDELLVEAVKRKIAPSSDAFLPSSFLDVSRARIHSSSPCNEIMPNAQYQPASLYDPHASNLDVEAGPSTPPPHSPKSPRIAAAQEQIDQTIAVMRDNINRIAARGERIQDLESRTESLAESARGFRRSAKKVRRNMYWKDMKMRFIIALAVIVVVGLTVLSIVQAVRSKQAVPAVSSTQSH